MHPQPLARKHSPILVWRQSICLLPPTTSRDSDRDLLRRVELVDILQHVCRRRHHHAPSRVHSASKQQRTKRVQFTEQHKRLEEARGRKALYRLNLSTYSVASCFCFTLCAQQHPLPQDCPQKRAVLPAVQRLLAISRNPTKSFRKHQEHSKYTQSREGCQEPENRSPSHRASKQPTDNRAQSQAELSR